MGNGGRSRPGRTTARRDPSPALLARPMQMRIDCISWAGRCNSGSHRGRAPGGHGRCRHGQRGQGRATGDDGAEGKRTARAASRQVARGATPAHRDRGTKAGPGSGLYERFSFGYINWRRLRLGARLPASRWALGPDSRPRPSTAARIRRDPRAFPWCAGLASRGADRPDEATTRSDHTNRPRDSTTRSGPNGRQPEE